MGRLAGFKYREVIKRLKALGFEVDRALLKQAGIAQEEFLRTK